MIPCSMDEHRLVNGSDTQSSDREPLFVHPGGGRYSPSSNAAMRSA
jgi:hypothetical protein